MTLVPYDPALTGPINYGMQPSSLFGRRTLVVDQRDHPITEQRAYIPAAPSRKASVPGALTPKTVYGNPPESTGTTYVRPDAAAIVKRDFAERGAAGSRVLRSSAMPANAGISWGERMGVEDTPAAFVLRVSEATLGAPGLMGVRAVRRDAYRGPVKRGVRPSPGSMISAGGHHTTAVRGLPGSPTYAGATLGQYFVPSWMSYMNVRQGVAPAPTPLNNPANPLAPVLPAGATGVFAPPLPPVVPMNQPALHFRRFRGVQTIQPAYVASQPPVESAAPVSSTTETNGTATPTETLTTGIAPTAAFTTPAAADAAAKAEKNLPGPVKPLALLALGGAALWLFTRKGR